MTAKSISLFVVLVSLLGACSTPPLPPPPEPIPGEIVVDDLKIKSFQIAATENAGIYADVNFAADKSNVWRGKIEHYEAADLATLKASFDVVAAKVTVGDKEQLSAQTANDFSKAVTYRLHASDGQYKEFVVELKNGVGTGLPLAVLTTDGNKPIVSKEDWLAGRMVLDPQQSGVAQFAGVMEIKGRGNNSWRLDKKPYAIKLAEKTAVMGMNKHKRWVLLANASDRTLLRNRVAFEIARRTGLAWTPDSRFVEVFLNGTYLGSYLLCEQIKIDKNRVNIDEMEPSDIADETITGGYLLEFDRYWDEINKFRTKLCDLPVNIKEPDEEVLGEEQRTYIVNYVNDVEQKLYAADVVDPAYRNLIDINSFVDWWIVMELTGNRDSRLPGSSYMYKQRGGKLFAGPVWDFDLTTFKAESDFLLHDYEVDPKNPLPSAPNDRSLWYKRLFSDPEFTACAKERWLQFKAGEAGFEGIEAFIDVEAAKLKHSAEVNWAMWTIDSNINQDETLTWQEAIDKMRTNYKARLTRLDQLITAM